MKRIMKEETVETIVETTLGRVRIAATAQGVCRMHIGERAETRPSARSIAGSAEATKQARAHLEKAVTQLHEYLAGRRREFDLPLDLRGTEHQQRVWQNLLRIPFGKTLSYGELARRVGTPRAARAVGHACGSNPVWLVVPCHRVVGSDGALHGYGGGLWRKQKLLELEGARPSDSTPAQRALALSR